jgi:electron transfer flavoprotein beta subunit
MKVLTLVRQVPNAEGSLFTKDGAIDLERTELQLDTMDEYGVEQALRFRDEGLATEVIALAVGPARSEQVLRSALALGADRAVHVQTDLFLDPICLSKIVSQIATKEGVELIFCGGRQADWDSEALGGAVAERMGWPQLTWVTQLELKHGELSGRHDVDDGSEGFAVPLPAVVTTQQGLNEPRYPTLPNIMKARKKELRSETLEQYGVSPLLKITNTEVQSLARSHKLIRAEDDPSAAAQKLVEVLHTDLKVLA